MAQLLHQSLSDFQAQFPCIFILFDVVLVVFTMRALCDGTVWSALIVVSFAISLLVVLVGDAAGKNSVLVRPDSPLIQDEPGHKPGDLQEEDAGQTDGGVDTKRLESRHVLRNTILRFRHSQS